MVGATGAWGDKVWENCQQRPNLELRKQACTEILARGEKENSATRILAYFLRGFADWFNGENNHGVGDFTKAIELNAATRRDRSAQLLFYDYRGRAYQDRGDQERAIEDFNEAIALGSKGRVRSDSFAAYHFLRGFSHKIKGDTPRALTDFNKAVEIYRHREPFSSVARAQVLAVEGSYKEAIAELNNRIAKSPSIASDFRDRGWAYLKMGEAKKAKADFAKAREIRPGIWLPDMPHN